MGRPPMPVGTFGRIAYLPVGSGQVRARARFRDYDGRVRPVSRYGPTNAAAERALREALRDRVGPTGSEITADTRLLLVAELWLENIKASDLSIGTQQTYETALRSWVLPGAGELTVREVRPAAVDRLLKAVTAKNGPGAAKTARTVLSGVMQLAVQHGAIDINPVRHATRLSGPRKERPRALRAEEEGDMLMWLGYSDRALYLDLVDLVDFMIGTGLRIGESLAVPRTRQGGTLEVNATVVRVKGKGLIIQPRTKSEAGWRVIALPPYVDELIDRRVEAEYPDKSHHTLFPTVLGHLRDPNNTSGDLREVLDWGGYDWITSHVFRKTIATKLDDAGLSARQIADHLGHANPSMTQDVYLGRSVVTAEAATILDRPGAQLASHGV